MKKFTFKLFLSLQVCLLLGASDGCGSTVQIDSLCIVDTHKNVCWIDQAVDEKLPISEIDTWFAMDEDDFRKILNKLNECDSRKSAREENPFDKLQHDIMRGKFGEE